MGKRVSISVSEWPSAQRLGYGAHEFSGKLLKKSNSWVIGEQNV